MNIIVNFHRVSSSEWVDGMVKMLKSRFRLIGADSVCHHLDNGGLKNCCHITVDDGDGSFYRYIYPVLKRHRVPCSLYVSPKVCAEKSNFWFQEVEGYAERALKPIISDVAKLPVSLANSYNMYSVLKMLPLRLILEIINKYQRATRTPAKRFQNMSVQELVEVQNSGLVTVGAHTVNHPVLRNEDDAGSRYEVEQSLARLSDILGHRVEYFAYPNGLPALDFSEREKELLARAGVKVAFSTETSSLPDKLDRMSTPRIGASDRESARRFLLKLYAARLCSSYSRLKPHCEYRERMELRRLMAEA